MSTRSPPSCLAKLRAAVVTCLEISPVGDCVNGPYGPIGKWDVSSVTSMFRMFHGATAFNSDISKWDVSSVTGMHGMFWDATAFNGDISQWDVARVTEMSWMFKDAAAFNGDISKWDVSSVTDMSAMFLGARAFKQALCGAWITSTARKDNMFKHSPGSICPTLTTTGKDTIRLFTLSNASA